MLDDNMYSISSIVKLSCLYSSIIPDICLNVTTLQALALEYLIALHPFVLIVISYFAIDPL